MAWPHRTIEPHTPPYQTSRLISRLSCLYGEFMHVKTMWRREHGPPTPQVDRAHNYSSAKSTRIQPFRRFGAISIYFLVWALYAAGKMWRFCNRKLAVVLFPRAPRGADYWSPDGLIARRLPYCLLESYQIPFTARRRSQDRVCIFQSLQYVARRFRHSPDYIPAIRRPRDRQLLSRHPGTPSDQVSCTKYLERKIPIPQE
jgi:hypothetical protein